MNSPVDLQAMHNFLLTLSGKEILFLPNVGNAGDSLIAAGTYQAFRRAGLAPTLINDSDDVRDRVVVLGGGGSLVPMYAEMRCSIETFLLAGAAQFVILPHTIRGNEDMLRRLPNNTTIFCRDVVSYAHVLENSDAAVYLDHDMAFHLHVDVFDDWCAERYPDAPELYETRRADVERVVALGGGEARFLREDGERSGKIPLTSASLDLATVFAFGVWPDNAEKSVYCVLQAIRSAKRIVTDRLHMSVAAGLLGIPCELFDNSYGKNRQIYLHSIRRFCQSVHFVA